MGILRPVIVSAEINVQDSKVGQKSVADASENRAVPRFVLRPAGRWEVVDVRELLGSWHIFWAFLWRNIFRRNRQTLLGPLWFVITPLAKMLLFTLALGKIARLPSEGNSIPPFHICRAAALGTIQYGGIPKQ